MFSKHKQGKPLGSQVRPVVNNVRLYFAKTKDDKIKEGDETARCINVMKETSLATGISEWAVKMARKKTSEEGGCDSPNRRRPNRVETQCLDDFEKCALRRFVHTMYVDGENVTLDTVTAAVQEKMDKTMSRSTIRKQLLQIGFKFRKVFVFCFVCIKAEHIFHVHWPGFEFLRYVWGPEAGGTARLQSQGEGGAANPHRPWSFWNWCDHSEVPQGFEPWTFESKVQYPTPELPAPLFRKVNSRKLLTEKPQVVAARSVFLRSIRRVREQTPDRAVIYLDETWYNQYDMKTVAWLDDSDIIGRKTVIGKGKRLILLHAGSKSGFIPQAWLCMRTDGKSADYHSSMNAEVLERWFQEQLLPHIPPHSVIVMDNASYHSRSAKTTPSSNWRKAAIQEWLREEGIDFDPEMRKVELLELVRPLRQRKEYVLDNLAREAGHDIIMLPPYHCDLNPIELIWAQMKVYVRQRNTSGRLDDVKRLLQEAYFVFQLQAVGIFTPYRDFSVFR